MTAKTPTRRIAAVTLQTPVRDLLAARPELRPVLVRAGLTGLDGKCYWPQPQVTIETAAQRHEVDAQALLKIVNEEITKQKDPAK